MQKRKVIKKNLKKAKLDIDDLIASGLVSKNKTTIAVTDKIIILANSIKITVIILHSIFNFIYKKSAIGTSPTAGWKNAII